MKPVRDIHLGLAGLGVHKLRTFLSTLGVIFGVAAVVAMMAIGEGARREALEKYALLGVNNIIVREPPLSRQERLEARAGFSRGLSIQDARAIEMVLDEVLVAAPQREVEVEAKVRDIAIQTTVVGTVPEYQWLLNYRVDRGRFFTPDQEQRRQRVCVLGAEAERKLFPLESAVGRSVKLGDQWFQVIGVMAPKGRTIEVSGVTAFRDLDQDVYIPLATSLERMEEAPDEVRQTRRGVRTRAPELPSQIDQITIKVARSDRLRETAGVVRRILDRRHHGQGDYDILIPEVLLAQEQEEKRMFDVVLASIAGISLLVGGIGIMNIMLASVLERTREIGLRLAVGARPGDILGQFVVEASLISLLGGAAGILLGFLLAFGIDRLADFRAEVSPGSILIAFGVASLVGLTAGIYPARRASQLNPIEALRHE